MAVFFDSNRRSSGFTLLELIVGAFVISIMATYSAAAITDAVHNFRLSAASSKILHDLRYAQHQSMNKNGWYGVEFFAGTSAGSYHVYFTDGTTDTDVIDPANRAAFLSVNLGQSFSVTLSSVNIDGGNKVEFDPRGRPYDDKNGSALLLDGSLLLVSGGKSKIILIFKETGRVDALWN